MQKSAQIGGTQPEHGATCPEPNRDRYVYFVQAESSGLIKIGVADTPMNRISALQTACPDRLTLLGLMRCPDNGETERRLHQAFSWLRVRGEWFHSAPILLSYIERHTADRCAMFYRCRDHMERYEKRWAKKPRLVAGMLIDPAEVAAVAARRKRLIDARDATNPLSC